MTFNTAFCYIDKSVLVVNGPLVNFIGNYIRDSSDVFFHILTSVGFDDVISSFCTVVCTKILVFMIKRKLHCGLKI